jgi:hypothetical protein
VKLEAFTAMKIQFLVCWVAILCGGVGGGGLPVFRRAMLPLHTEDIDIMALRTIGVVPHRFILSQL